MTQPRTKLIGLEEIPTPVETMRFAVLLLRCTLAAQVVFFPFYEEEENLAKEDIVKLEFYIGLSKEELSTKILTLSSHLYDYTKTVFDFYSHHNEKAAAMDPYHAYYQRSKKLDPEYETPLSFVHLRYAMFQIMNFMLNPNESPVPLVDLMLWHTATLYAIMPPMMTVGTAVRWDDELSLDYYVLAESITDPVKREERFRILAKTIYSKAIIAMRMGFSTDDRLSRQNCHLLLSLSRLYYLIGLWTGSFVPAQKSYVYLCATIEHSLALQKLFFRDPSHLPVAFDDKWQNRLDYLEALIAEIYPLLQFFTPVSGHSRNFVFTPLYQPIMRKLWQPAIGPYRTQQIDEYFAAELGIMKNYMEMRDKENSKFLAEVEAEFGEKRTGKKGQAEKNRKGKASKKANKQTAKPVKREDASESDEEMALTTAMSSMTLQSFNFADLSVSMLFAMRLIVAQHLYDSYICQEAPNQDLASRSLEFWRERNEAVHPNRIDQIVIDGAVSAETLRIVTEIARLAHRPVISTQPEWTTAGLMNPQWASHAHTILQASHLCDSFDFSTLSTQERDRLSIYCARLKSKRNKYAHPQWSKQPNLPAMLKHFNF